MCILLYVKPYVWCWKREAWYSIGETLFVYLLNGQLEGGRSVFQVYVHSAICETYLVSVVFHRSMVNCRRGALVYVLYAICATSLV